MTVFLFKPGDRVRMVERVPGTRGTIYTPGMTAVVVGSNEGEVWVKWDDGTPNDECGFFWPHRFEKIGEPSAFDQLVQSYIKSELNNG